MFALKFASRTFIVATMALWLGTAGSAHAVDSFFDVFVGATESGLTYSSLTGPTLYRDAAGDIIQTEMVSMSLTSHGPVTVTPGSGNYAVDSFFDITYEIDLSGGQYVVDSFFDVFTTLRVTPETQTDTQRTFQTEILSMDLAGLQGPVVVRPDISRKSNGHITVLKRPDGNYNIDSFFDVFTELSVDTGTTWYPSVGSTRLESSFVTPEPSTLALLVGAALTLAVLRVRRTKVSVR